MARRLPFISVLIDDQSLERPIIGSVFENRDGKTAQMVWSRSSRSDMEGAGAADGGYPKFSAWAALPVRKDRSHSESSSCHCGTYD